MGARRRARECALMMLYQIDLSGTTPEKAIERFWSTYASGEPLDPPPPFKTEDGDEVGALDDEVKGYAEGLVRGVSVKRAELDEIIQKVSIHWRLDRMACV